MNRYEGIDLLKFIAILSIPFLHFCSYFYKEQPDDIKFIFMHMVRWMSFAGVGLFMTISGFLYLYKAYTKKYWIKFSIFYLKFFVYCFITAAVYENIKELWDYFFRYSTYFWFVAYWIGMLLLIPFLNKAIQECTKKEYLIAITVFFILFSLPNALEQFNDMYDTKVHLSMYWNVNNFPLLYYMIGAGFRKYHLKISKRVCLLGIIGCLLLNSFYDYWYCRKYLTEFGKHLYTNNYYANPITIIIVILLFGGMYYIKIHSKFKRILSFFSSISFEMYLGLICADKWIGGVREKIELILITNGFSYYWSCIVWEVGELIITFLLAVLVNEIIKVCLFFLKFIKRRLIR
ncbi:MAG: acyltransferase family protein [Lachnospiraceae bacterium]|nr:acyltransferase family protein [Lachnospiraceae bacterium]